MIEDYYGLTDNIMAVEDGEVLDLGERKLVFYPHSVCSLAGNHGNI